MSTEASQFIHGKQFKHWDMYRKQNVGATGQDAINSVVDEMLTLNRIETFRDVNEEDVEMG